MRGPVDPSPRSVAPVRFAWWVLLLLPAILSMPPGCSQGTSEVRTGADSEPVQVVEEHWPDGTLRVRKQVLRQDDGSLVEQGTFTRWFASGQKEYEATFARGVLDGVETRWHENGTKATEAHYVNGLRDGTRRVWDANGMLRKEEHFVDDQPDGTWTVWDGEGEIEAQIRFDHGVPQP
jgi:hypothetical protein